MSQQAFTGSDDPLADTKEFSEPWQAEAFAIAIELSRVGYFSWSDWVAVFSDQIVSFPQRPGESANDAYYRQWLTTLDLLLRLTGLLTDEEIATYQEDWRRSYYHTPHGKPIVFAQRLEPIPQDANTHQNHEHEHHMRPQPITVSPRS